MQFKLISVDFKEAALDSATFRANVNYLDLQISNIETWLQAIMQFLAGFPNYEKDIKAFTYLYLDHLRPTLLQEGFLEQEYTVMGLQYMVSDLQSLWELGISILQVNRQPLGILNRLLSSDIPRYRKIRQSFETIQLKYDTFMVAYYSVPKLKDPSIVMDDAVQLHEVRKQYLHACLEITTELNNLAAKFDREFIKFSIDIWQQKSKIFEDFENIKARFNLHWKNLIRLNEWSEQRTKSQAILDQDIEIARKNVETQAIDEYKPLPFIDDYKPQLINTAMLDNINEPSFEKHGIVYMKTYRTNNPQKPIWSKRWAYIKGGVFGILNLSPLGNSVQETDKIGLLICNIKYAVNEERRNCFEVKTVDLSFIFQTELLIRLKLWLKVYANERDRILNSNDETSMSIASQRFPPILKELADTINSLTDRQLTSSKIVSKDGRIILSLKLSSHIERNQKTFKKYVYNKMSQINTPFVTELTKLAILSYSLVTPTSIPTALTANIWGSINWGLFYMNTRSRQEALENAIGTENSLIKNDQLNETDDEAATSSSPDPDTSHILKDEDIKSKIPAHLVSADMQLRALFETAVGPGEICLFSYNCTWIPNLKQELTGKCFISAKHVYAYFNEKGFVSMFKNLAANLTSFDVTPGELYDYVKMYTISATIKMKLFLEDAAIIKRKMEVLIENNVRSVPRDNEELIRIFQDIDKEFTAKKVTPRESRSSTVSTLPLLTKSRSPIRRDGNMDTLVNSSSNQPAVGPPSPLQAVPAADRTTTSLATVSPDNSKTRQYKIDYSDSMTFLARKDYHIPPKAVFHVLLGDHSMVFQSLSSVSRLQNVVKKPWYILENGNMARKYNAIATYFSRRENLVQFYQEVDGYEENEYYSFIHRKGPFQCLVGGPFYVEYRVVIYGTLLLSSRVAIYSSPIFTKKEYLATFVVDMFSKILLQEARSLHNQIKLAERDIGTHGLIAKSIILYGKLLTLPNLEEVPDVKPAYFGILSGIWLLFNRLAIIVFHFLGHFTAKLFDFSIAIIKAIALNKIILLFLLILMVVNIFMAGRIGTNYWYSRKASSLAEQMVKTDPYTILHAVYIKDYSDYISEDRFGSVINGSSKCFDAFNSTLFLLNHGKLVVWDREYFNEETKNFAMALQSTLTDIGVQRNELLTKLKILNNMELEISEAEWRNWLLSESQRCQSVMAEGIDLPRILDYCRECISELDRVGIL